MIAPLKTILILTFLFVVIQSTAQVDTIDMASKDLTITTLKPGLHQYLVYFQRDQDKNLTGFSLWNREVNIKKMNGKDFIEITQHWYNNDTTFNRYVYSLSKIENFEPVYHYTKSSRGIEAFTFQVNQIIGTDSIQNNSKRDFALAVKNLPLNWELDLEIFNTLPIKKVGQRFIVPFYHPGGRSNPNYYEYAVIGTEKLEFPGAGARECWQLKINYTDTDWAIFWLSKKTKEVVKMQERFKGGYRYKVRTSTPVSIRK